MNKPLYRFSWVYVSGSNTNRPLGWVKLDVLSCL